MANYDLAEHWESLNPHSQAQIIRSAPLGELEKWAADPECRQQVLCLKELKTRRAESAKSRVPGWTPAMSDPILTSPRTGLSEDARHIGGLIAELAGRNLKQELKALAPGI